MSDGVVHLTAGDSAMEAGVFEYLSWCVECAKVTRHLHGTCLVCVPVGFPRPAVILRTVEKPLCQESPWATRTRGSAAKCSPGSPPRET